jgi:FixJ family two-component response regulator
MKIDTGTVLIVDDDPGIRDSLSCLLTAAGLATHCLESGDALLGAALPEGPACILLDLQMPGASGIQVQEALKSRGSELPVIFLTGHAEVHAAVSAMKSGAIDFIVKSELDPVALVARVRDCLHQHAVALAEQRSHDRLRQRLMKLTPRELEVARLAAGGSTNLVIGIELGISERTVEIHRGRAMKKLELRTAADLARLHDRLRETA